MIGVTDDLSNYSDDSIAHHCSSSPGCVYRVRIYWSTETSEVWVETLKILTQEASYWDCLSRLALNPRTCAHVCGTLHITLADETRTLARVCAQRASFRMLHGTRATVRLHPSMLCVRRAEVRSAA